MAGFRLKNTTQWYSSIFGSIIEVVEKTDTMKKHTYTLLVALLSVVTSNAVMAQNNDSGTDKAVKAIEKAADKVDEAVTKGVVKTEKAIIKAADVVEKETIKASRVIEKEGAKAGKAVKRTFKKDQQKVEHRTHSKTNGSQDK